MVSVKEISIKPAWKMNSTIKTIIVSLYRTNCYLFINEDTKECVIIDPGDEADVIRKVISTREVIPKAILLTHGHGDHVSALNEIKKEYEIEVYASGDEQFFLKDYEIEHSVRENDIVRAAGFELKVIETPGHSKGSLCYYCEDQNILFSGDTMFYMTYGRTDFETGSFEDMKQSMKKLFNLPGDTRVYPGHGFSTTIAIESVKNAILMDI